jgi:peptide deformylase
MSVREIEIFGAPVLSEKAERVETVDGRILGLVRDMIETLEEAGGVGLAANQVGEPTSVILVKTGSDEEEGGTVRVFVNPEVVYVEGASLMEEGCLSLPGLFCEVERPEIAVVRAQELKDGMVEEVQIQARGLDARVFLHEIDHLNGTLFVDRLDPTDRAVTLAKWLRERETQDSMKEA